MKIIENGSCECIYEPRGDFGLEGFSLNTIYKYELRVEPKIGLYYKVFPNDPFIPSYGSTCTNKAFRKCFKIVNSAEENKTMTKWKICPTDDKQINLIRDSNGQAICTTLQKEHAQLIASAPKLLEACKIVISQDGEFFDLPDNVSQILLKVIAQAEEK